MTIGAPSFLVLFDLDLDLEAGLSTLYDASYGCFGPRADLNGDFVWPPYGSICW